ncbi:MAG TPA: hypothetical protein VFX70_02270 [Mycobacteriales bacterium]|nr:hypothetical protein [Mycobacteriales bacterium]
MTSQDQNDSGTDGPAVTGAAPADVAATCERLQRELDTLMGEQDEREATRSLDSAVASIRQVEQQNVSAVQLVALAGD